MNKQSNSSGEIDLDETLNTVFRIVRHSGSLLLSLQEEVSGVKEKKDGTKFSDSDIISSKYIFGELRKSFPSASVLDEENGLVEGTDPRYCWIVDPLDNSRDYIEGRENYSIIIGLTDNSRSVLGVVYKPASDELFCAIRGKGAYVYKGKRKERIEVDSGDRISLVVSSSRSSPSFEEDIGRIAPDRIDKLGGSIKIIEVAKGKSSAFLQPPGQVMHLWDVCGSGLILEEAGGVMSDYAGNAITFDPRNSRLENGLVVSGKKVYNNIIKKLRR